MPTFLSFAKVNLHLEIVARRADGYHDLRTLFQTIDLSDSMRIERIDAAREVRLEVTGAALPTDEANLAVRAARRYLERWGGPGDGLAIELEKRIPVGGGLGGGSANAATVLSALGMVLDRPAPLDWLAATAAELGADVPFFLTGGTAIGLGRGDRIVPLDDPPGSPLELWLAISERPISTAAVFDSVAPPAGERPARAPIAALLAGEPAPPLAELIGENDLEQAAFRLRPDLGALYTAIGSSGARRVGLSGSGSTLFAQFDDPAAARSAAANLPPGTLWKRVGTLGRAAWRAQSGVAAIGKGA